MSRCLRCFSLKALRMTATLDDLFVQRILRKKHKILIHATGCTGTGNYASNMFRQLKLGCGAPSPRGLPNAA